MIAAVGTALTADAYDPVLHEYILRNERDDVTVGVPPLAGGLPAAVDTQSGVLYAPDTQRAPTAQDPTYTAAATPASTYVPDRDVRTPGALHYDEPFSPSVAPFKRMRAFDAVDADGTLHVRDPALHRVPVGGKVAADEDPFYGDITADFGASGGLVAIPSPGPGARALHLVTVPRTQVELFTDGAENWYAKSAARGRVRLILELAVRRNAFGGDFALAERDDAGRQRISSTALPARLAKEARTVAARAGVSQREPARRALDRLVSYFRAFTPSEVPIPASAAGDVYLDLALSQKGVCRHRAYAFLVTALGLGISARMVHNEAHAWVEVEGTDGWHRIDLGGAASDVTASRLSDKVAYQPALDPFAWPAGAADTGRRLGEQLRVAARGAASGPAQDTAAGTGAAGAAGTGAAGAAGAAKGAGAARGAGTPDRTDGAPRADESSTEQPRAQNATSGDERSSGDPASTAEDANESSAASDEPSRDDAPRSDIAITFADNTVMRGDAVHVRGTLRAAGGDCSRAPVDIALVEKTTGIVTTLGATSTDEHGDFDASPIVPPGLAVGDYELVARSPGDPTCGPAQSEGR